MTQFKTWSHILQAIQKYKNKKPNSQLKERAKRNTLEELKQR